MGIDIGAAFNNAGQFIQQHNPLTDEGRANIGKNTVKTVGGVTKAGLEVGKAVGNFISPPAQAPTVLPKKRQPKADRQLANPQGSYYGDSPQGQRRVFTPERPPVGRLPGTKTDGYLPRLDGADSAPLAPGQSRNVVDATGKLVTATGTQDGRTVYTNQWGKQYILPAGAKPGDYRMGARPEKMPTLRLQAEADIEAKNGAVHTTPNGTRFFIGNPDRQGQRTVIEIDKSGQAVEGAKARLYSAAKSNSAIVKRLDSENPNRGAFGNTLANTKQTAVRQGARIDLAGQGAMNNIVWTPLGGLLSLGGVPQLKNAVARVDKQISEQQAARGVTPNMTLEAGTSLVVNGVMAYGGGSVAGKVGGATKLSRTVSVATQTVVLPAASTVGTHAAQGRLGGDTVKEIAISGGLNLIGLPISAKTVRGQAFVGIGSGVITQTALGQEITARGLLELTVNSFAGAHGAHRAMKPGAGSKPAPEPAPPPLSIDLATRNLNKTVALHREGRGSVEAVRAARLAAAESYKANKSTMSPDQRSKWRDASAKSEGIIAGFRSDTAPKNATPSASTVPVVEPQASSVVLPSQQGRSGSTRPSGIRATATVSGGAPERANARPLPAAVAAVATKLGLSVADVQLLRDALGGTFGATDAVNHLQNRSDSPLNAAQATELVKAIRSAQNESTRGVKAAVDAALAREASPGTAQSVFTQADWNTIEPLLNAQPALDNAAARQLRRLLESGRVDPQAKARITEYLKSVGDEFTTPAGRSNATEAVPTSNLSSTDAGFAKLLILTGQSKAQVNVGVADAFSTTVPGHSVLLNSQAVQPVDVSSIEHGHGTASLVGKAGRWVNIKTVMLPNEFSSTPGVISRSVDRLAAENVRVINMSLGVDTRHLEFQRTESNDWRAAMARHPDVLFVISAGNEGLNSARLPFADSIAAGMPNVIYVGNVDTAGNLANSSVHGNTIDIYAPGVNRQVVHGQGKRYDPKSGTSLSSPEVVSVVAKMLVLCPTLKPAAVRDIIRQTASAPPIGATDVDGSVAKTGILNGDAATKVAALMTMTQRVGGLERAANALKLSAPERSRFLPIAQRQLALASNPERSAAPTSGTRRVGQTGQTGGRALTSTTPAEAHGVRVHQLGREVENHVNGQRVTDEQISRLAGGTDDTLIDVSDNGVSYYGVGMNVYAASKHHGDAIELGFLSKTIRIYREPLLWRAGLSDPRSAAAAETRALAIMATQAQALGLTTISIAVQPGTARAAEWAKRGFLVASPETKNRVDFDLTSGSQSWRQLVKQVKSLGIQLPAGLPADALSANDAATRGFFRKFLGR